MRNLSHILSVLLMLMAIVSMPSVSKAQDVEEIVEIVDSVEDGKGEFFIIDIIKTTHWPSTITGSVLDGMMRKGLVNGFKNNVEAWRPDGSTPNSFPSNHAAIAFDYAVTVINFGVRYSPFIGIAAQAVADGISFERIINERHYPGDVISGAVIGAGSYLVTTGLVNWIYNQHNKYRFWYTHDNVFARSLSVSTGLCIPLQRSFGEYSIGQSLYSNLRLQIPMSQHYGLCIDGSICSGPIRHNGSYLEPLTTIGAMVGACAHKDFGRSPYAIGSHLIAGYVWNLNTHHVKVGYGSIAAQAAIEGSVMVTKNYSVGLETMVNLQGQKIGGTARVVSPISISIYSVARF